MKCIICGARTSPQYATETRSGWVCPTCSRRVLTCSRCRERVLDSEACVYAGDATTPAETICISCLTRRAAGREIPPPYWER